MLRFSNWNVKKNFDFCLLNFLKKNLILKIEISSSGLDKESLLKINDMINYRNMVDGISLIKFCNSVSELESFQINSLKENELQNDENSSKPDENITDEVQSHFNNKNEITTTNLNYVLFLIKLESINCSFTTNVHDAVRMSLKKNSTNLSNAWYATILYVRIIMIDFYLILALLIFIKGIS